jgi:hypothetical protein
MLFGSTPSFRRGCKTDDLSAPVTTFRHLLNLTCAILTGRTFIGNLLFGVLECSHELVSIDSIDVRTLTTAFLSVLDYSTFGDEPYKARTSPCLLLPNYLFPNREIAYLIQRLCNREHSPNTPPL